MLGTKGQPAYRRMNAVTSEDQIEGAGSAVFKFDVYRVCGLGECGDRITEQILTVGGSVLLKDFAKVATQDLDVTANELACHDSYLAAGGIEVHHISTN